MADVADSFQEGRIFLAGDAAHVMPPYGGYGGNTGIQDAHNLAWKLAAVHEGRAGPCCSRGTTPSAGRPRVHRRAGLHPVRRTRRAGPGAGGVEPIVGDLEIDLGTRMAFTRWRSSSRTETTSWTSIRASHARRLARVCRTCGSRREGRRISTLDLVGDGFVLLAGLEADVWVQAVDGAELTVHRIGGQGGLGDPDGAFA